MARRSPVAHLASVTLDPTAVQPLYRQLYFALREAILGARLTAEALASVPG
jgi:hypothetical protein